VFCRLRLASVGRCAVPFSSEALQTGEICPIIGTDGIGTSFGNSATGIVDGPAQANLDLALSKTVVLRWPIEKSSFQLRAEFFNALNHTQFANPDTKFTSPTFGVVSSTAVNPRVGQLALRFAFWTAGTEVADKIASKSAA
jgi:hypothetical protein